MEELRVCLNCQNSFSGRYCNECGEKVIVTSDRSLKQLLIQLGEVLFSLDNKFLRSIKALILSPGLLTTHYSLGPRKRLLSPMSLFVILSVLYFLFPIFQTFNATLNTHLNIGFYSEWAATAVMKYSNGDDQRFTEYMLAFNEATGNYGRMVIFIFVIILTIPISILNYAKSLYIADHAMASFEVNAFLILVNAFVLPIISYLGLFIGIEDINRDSVMGVFIMLFILYSLILIHIKYYKNPWWLSMIKSGLLMMVLFYTLQLYRCVVFYITHWSIT